MLLRKLCTCALQTASARRLFTACLVGPTAVNGSVLGITPFRSVMCLRTVSGRRCGREAAAALARHGGQLQLAVEELLR